MLTAESVQESLFTKIKLEKKTSFTKKTSSKFQIITKKQQATQCIKRDFKVKRK